MRRRGIVNYRHFEHFRFFFFNGLRSLSYILLSISTTYVCIIFDQKTIIRITLTYISELGHHFLVLRRLINFPLTMDRADGSARLNYLCARFPSVFPYYYNFISNNIPNRKQNFRVAYIPSCDWVRAQPTNPPSVPS